MSFELTTLHLHLTRNCNLACKHCWVSSGPNVSAEMLPLSLVKKVVSDSMPLGLKEVKLSGGEPFLYPHLANLIKFLSDCGLSVKIESNGILGLESIRHDIDNNPIEFAISLDGPSSSVHAKMRGDESSFQTVLDTCDEIKKIGSKLTITTLLTNYNLSHLTEIVELVQSLHADQHRIILNLNPSGRAADHLDGALSLDDTFAALRTIESYAHYDESRLKSPCIYTTLPAAFQSGDKFFNTCFWGVNLCTVLDNGNVSICGAGFEQGAMVAGNIHEDEIGDIWNGSQLFLSFRKSYNVLGGICGNCVFFAQCRGLCRAQSVAVYDSLYAPYPFCQYAYENGIFPTEYMVNKDLDCSFESLGAFSTMFSQYRGINGRHS